LSLRILDAQLGEEKGLGTATVIDAKSGIPLRNLKGGEVTARTMLGSPKPMFIPLAELLTVLPDSAPVVHVNFVLLDEQGARSLYLRPFTIRVSP
jgi:hypothetical protein